MSSLTGLESPVGTGQTEDDGVGGDNTAMTMAVAEASSIDACDDKGHTFRRRRLSVDNLRNLDADTNGGEAGPTVEEEAPTVATSPVQDERAHSFRKRRLSLTHSREESSSATDADEGPPRDVGTPNDDNPNKRRRRNSEGSASTMDSHGNGSISNNNNANPPRNLKSRTLHAAELLAQPPPSPAQAPTVPKLYQHAAPPQNLPLLDAMGDDGHHDGTHIGPKWKKRHTRHASDDRNLPFPRDVVGTFSCHGVEPIYDSDFQTEFDDDDDDDEEDDDVWVVGGVTNANGVSGGSQLGVSLEKPTMAAKINQDRGGVVCPYGNSAKTALFAVYDGHGQGGELVSQYALHEVQRLLEKHPDFELDIGKAFRETFVKVDSSLTDEVLIEPLYAGSTACVALLRGQRLTLSNAGDSRAVLARKVGAESWGAIDLTVDQNPDLPEEQERILSMGGFVSPPPEPGLSARVWLDAECSQIGLAMARSIGDHAVKPVGVIADPVISYHDIEEDDDFVILATDGVWEFITSEEAVQIVANNLHKGATRACRSLIEAAAARWHDEEGDYRDDITALVIRLQHLWGRDGPNGKTQTTS